MRPRIPRAVGLLLIGVLFLGFLGAGASDSAARALTVDDVLRLHYAGVGEDVILSEILVTDSVFDLDVDEILRLHEAGVSDRLVQFMIDTARTPATESDVDANASAAETVEEEAGEGDSVQDDEDEDRVAYRTGVSLRWGYPLWWYDLYWWDYWYYDCAYYPWSVSWSWSCGAWYPVWHAPGHFRVSPAWGYRWSWWSSYPHWNADWRWACDRWYYPPDPEPRGLSDWKYKANGGTGGKALVAAGLRTRDGARLPTHIVQAKAPLTAERDAKRPGSGGIRKPDVRAGGSAPDDLRRPIRPVRKPADTEGRPIKKHVKKTGTDPGVRDPIRNPPPVHPKVPDKPAGQGKPKDEERGDKKPARGEGKATGKPDRAPDPAVRAPAAPKPAPEPPPSAPPAKSPPPGGRGSEGPPPSRGSKGR
jgi:hypothetical protein